jgi:cytochrome P450
MKGQFQDDKAVDDEQAMNILAMLIGAGSDTTSSVMQTFFKVMALHPLAVSMAQAGVSSSNVKLY